MADSSALEPSTRANSSLCKLPWSQCFISATAVTKASLKALGRLAVERMGLYPAGGRNHVWILTLSHLGLTCWAGGSGRSYSVMPEACAALTRLHPSPSTPPVHEHTRHYPSSTQPPAIPTVTTLPPTTSNSDNNTMSHQRKHEQES